jgi:hypothetical protein
MPSEHAGEPPDLVVSIMLGSTQERLAYGRLIGLNEARHTPLLQQPRSHPLTAASRLTKSSNDTLPPRDLTASEPNSTLNLLARPTTVSLFAR